MKLIYYFKTKVNKKDVYLIGEKIEFTCSKGYRYKTISNSLECSTNETWIGDLVECLG